MTTLAICWNDLACYLRDKPAMFWTFLGPIICIIAFGFLTQPRVPPPPLVVLVDHDAGPMAERLSQNLKAAGYIVRQATEEDPNQWSVEILSDPSRSTAVHLPVRTMLHGADQESNQERSVRFDLEHALVRLSQPAGSSGPIQVVTGRSSFTPQAMTRGFQRAVPAYLIMFLTLNLLVGGSNLAEDRENGRLRRMLISPAGKPRIIAGKLLARLTVGWTQMAMLFVIGVFVFRMTFAEHPVLLFAFLSLYALAIGAVGILIGAVCRDPDQAHTMAIWVTMIMAPLGGLWWPLELMPPLFRRLAQGLPTGWAMQGVNSMLAFGAGPGDIAWPAAGLAVLFVISFVLASSRLRAY